MATRRKSPERMARVSRAKCKQEFVPDSYGSDPTSTPDEVTVSPIDEMAAQIVTNTLETARAGKADPMLGDFSLLASILRSVVTRVGHVIPDVIANALRYDENLTVLREYSLPLTSPAAKIIDNNRNASNVELPHDMGTIGAYTADLVVIDTQTRHATILECRRGSVPYSSPKTLGALRTLRIASLTARKALEADGYRVASIGCGVVDRYGQAGYDAAMTVTPDKIDAFFGMPVRAHLDRLDSRIRDELGQHLSPIVRALIPAIVQTSADDVSALLEDKEEPEPIICENSAEQRAFHIALNRLVGPAERRAASRQEQRRFVS